MRGGKRGFPLPNQYDDGFVEWDLGGRYRCYPTKKRVYELRRRKRGCKGWNQPQQERLRAPRASDALRPARREGGSSLGRVRPKRHQRRGIRMTVGIADALAA